MKTLRASVAALLLAAASLAIAQQPAASPGPNPAAPIVIRSAEELEQLVGPIALYPDALIAMILPAATAPADVVLAARYVKDFPNDRSQVEHRAWDESVKSLTNYPDVLQWMDQNLQWTKQLGEAFIAQPADVMQAVQRLRAKARAAGTLVDTPQQQVIAEPQVIRIVPAQPDVIYVPRYEPDVVFVDRPVYYPASYISFGIGFPVGSWLAFDCDWHRHTIWMGNRHRTWSGHDWRRPLVPIAPPAATVRVAADVRPWRPAPQPPRPVFSVAYTQRTEIARPTTFGSGGNRVYGPRPPTTAYGDRRPPPNPLPVANALPRAAAPASTDFVGPRLAAPAPSPGVSQPVPGFRTQAPLATAPAMVTPAPALANRPATNRGWVRERENRGYTQPPAAPNAAPLPTVPSLPMAVPAQSHATAGPAAPQGARVYSHPVVPALPQAAPVRPATGPVVAAPAPQAQPAQTQPAQPVQRGDDHRGRRTEDQKER